MKLTTMKISVPVLMLMMFQSGYGVSDWFAKAWSAMNQGKTAEAFAIVQQQKPEKVGKLSTEQKTEFKKDWSKAVSDAVTNILPSICYEADGNLTPYGGGLRDNIVTLDDDGIMIGGVYAILGDTADNEINTANVNSILQERIVATADIPNESEWLLPDEDYISDENTGIGINKWVDALIESWQLEGEGAEDNNKKLLTPQGDDDFALRKDIHLADKDTIDKEDVLSVYDAIKDAGNAAKADGAGVAEEAALTTALRNALLDVLVNRIQNPTGTTDNEKLQYKNDQLRYFIQTYRDRVVTDDTETIKDYDGISDPNDPLEAILAKAGTTPTVDSISNAVDEVISADLSLLLRHTGSVDVDTLDNAIDNAMASLSDEYGYEDLVVDGLESVAQTFDNATASSIVSNLKAIKNN